MVTQMSPTYCIELANAFTPGQGIMTTMKVESEDLENTLHSMGFVSLFSKQILYGIRLG